jgi:hypothetical protein
MSNDSYCVMLHGRRTVERYYRDPDGWLKISTRGCTCRMAAAQVLNHLLPALASPDRLNLRVKVEHYDDAYWKMTLSDGERSPKSST